MDKNKIPILGSAIGNGSGLIGQFFAQRHDQRMAKDQRNFNLRTQQDQRNWDLQQWNRQNTYNEGRWNAENEYALKLWHMQNSYNSPQEQMARLKEAGLNPHLMYGQGTVGNTSSPASSGSTRGSALKSPDVKSYSRAQSRNILQGMDIFGQYQNFKSTQAQIDNLEASTAVAQQDEYYKAMKTANEVLSNQRGKFQFNLNKELRETQVEAAKANMEKVKNEAQKSLYDSQQSKIGVNIRGLDQKLKKHSLKLREEGLNENDPAYMRILIQQFKKDGLKTLMRPWNPYLKNN